MVLRSTPELVSRNFTACCLLIGGTLLDGMKLVRSSTLTISPLHTVRAIGHKRAARPAISSLGLGGWSVNTLFTELLQDRCNPSRGRCMPLGVKWKVGNYPIRHLNLSIRLLAGNRYTLRIT